ncbi:prolyl oligopeptidase family serine peptidase [Oceanihabitans sp.]|nr:prolyl oligopeptidase family serine peptidase [Oceanihabitans sp.]
MKRLFHAVLFVIPFMVISQESVKPEPPPQKNTTNTYFDTTLNDPYQFLEDLDNPSVVAWMKDNANYANSILDNISGKQAMLDKMLELINRTSAAISSLRITDDNTYFYLKRVPGEEISRMYKRDGYDGKEVLFFDPTAYRKEEGKTYTVNSIRPNKQGNKVAIIVAANGSENPEALIFDNNGKQFNETLQLSRGISWNASGDSFFYNKLNSPDVTDMNRKMYTQVFKHKIGTEQNSDEVYFSKDQYDALGIVDMEIPYVYYSKDTKYKFLDAGSVDKNMQTYVNKTTDDNKSWQPLTIRKNKVIDMETNHKEIYFLTYDGAPNYKIVKVPVETPNFSNATNVIEESKSENITEMATTKDGLYYCTVKNGVEAKVYFLSYNKTKPIELELPFTAGSASISTKGSDFSDIWINISGWTSPNKRYLYNAEKNSFTYQPLSTPAEYPELENLVAKEVMVKSHDGVMVPVSIIYNKDMKMNGQTPATIYTYGSYGNSTSPFFSPVILAYTIYGGALVVPHVRGGGELGDAWHKAGQKINKPNTWKDAIATAEYIINEGYTSSEKLSIFGGSAGGIMVGRSITERPDLFVAASPMVGAMNTVRMEETPNGPVNTPEFGTVKDPDEFRGLLEMDSYHHIEPGTDYPATLITAGINDPRVIAWQPAKFAAKMQYDNSGDSPILFLTDFEGGHGGGVALTKAMNRFSNMFSFFYWQSGHPEFQLKKPIKD